MWYKVIIHLKDVHLFNKSYFQGYSDSVTKDTMH